MMESTNNPVQETIDKVAEMNKAQAYKRILAAIDAAKEEMREKYRKEQREKQYAQVAALSGGGN